MVVVTYLPLILIGLIVVADLAVLVFAILPVAKVPPTYNLRNVLVRWKITAMTALAFTLVVGLLTVMLAFVKGMDKLTEGSGQPGNVMILSDGATDELFSTLAFDDASNVGRDEPDIKRNNRGQPLVSRELYVVVNQQIPNQTKRRFVQVRGIEDPDIAATVHGLVLYPGGSWFSDAGVQELSAAQGGAAGEQAIQAVLGEGVARELGHDLNKESLQIGDLFELGARKWVVVGITRSAGSTFSSETWAKSQKVGDLFGKQNVFTSMVARTANAEMADTVAKRLKEYKKTALQAQTETEYYAKLSETNKQFSVAIYFVAVIVGIGGIFGVMNSMFAAISQRTKDIGVLRILGYARWQILLSFLMETLVIALIGGLLGLALGYFFNGATATSIVSSGQGGGKSVILKLVVDGRVLLTGLLFTLVMGGLGGLLPALAAMRLRALESLR